jgi:hypothetical protein
VISVSQLWGGLVSDDTSMPQDIAAMSDYFFTWKLDGGVMVLDSH